MSPPRPCPRRVQDALRLLGFEPNSSSTPPSPREVKKRYLKQSLQKHPDKGGSKTEFQELANAYEHASTWLEAHPNVTPWDPPAGGGRDAAAAAAAGQQQQAPPPSASRRRRQADDATNRSAKASKSKSSRPKARTPSPPKATSSERGGRRSSSAGNRRSNSSNRTSRNQYMYESDFEEYDSDDNDDIDEECRYEEHYNFFHSFFRQHRSSNHEEYTTYYESAFDEWHERARRRAQQRRQDIKNKYDFRDQKKCLMAGAPAPNLRSFASGCMFCGVNHGITQSDAREWGLNYSEYVKHPSQFRTCWACLKDHTSVMTYKMAIRGFARVLDPEKSEADKIMSPGQRFTSTATSVFNRLRREKKSFHYQPKVKDDNGGYINTLNSEYFWYPDLEEAALSRGWKPRGTKKFEVPWQRKDLPTSLVAVPEQPPPVSPPTASPRRSSSKRKAKGKAVPVTPNDGANDGNQNANKERGPQPRNRSLFPGEAPAKKTKRSHGQNSSKTKTAGRKRQNAQSSCRDSSTSTANDDDATTSLRSKKVKRSLFEEQPKHQHPDQQEAANSGGNDDDDSVGWGSGDWRVSSVMDY